MKRSFTLVELVICLVILIALFLTAVKIFNLSGPLQEVEIEVSDKYVDTSGGGERRVETHYMVSTDVGIFEVSNGILLGLWNCDELYGRLKKGNRYLVKTRGRRIVGMFLQEYPYIVEVVREVHKKAEVQERDFENMTVKEVMEWSRKNKTKVEISADGLGPVVER